MNFNFEGGKIGVLLIIIAVVVSTFGGFMLNAHDVTSCATDFEYVTDVTGAFTGTNADMNVDYNPQSNVTGYSVFPPGETGSYAETLHGINYTPTAANGYWIQENAGFTTSSNVTLHNNKGTGYEENGTATITWSGESGVEVPIGDEYGMDTSEVKSEIVVDGTTHSRVVAIPLATLLGTYSGSMDTNNGYLTVQSPVNSYPCFIGDWEQTATIRGDWSRYVASELEYKDSSYWIQINPSTKSAKINGNNYAYGDVLFVWGESYSVDAEIQLILGSTTETMYIDPVFGVKPAAIDTSEERTVTEITTATLVRGSITSPYVTDVSNGAKGDIYIHQGTSSDYGVTKLCQYEIYNTPSDKAIRINDGHNWVPSGTSQGDITIYWEYDINNPSIYKLWFNVDPSSNDPSEINSVSVQSSTGGGIAAVDVTMYNGASSYSCNTSVSVITDVTHDDSQSITGGRNEFDTEVTSTHIETVTFNYSTTYWCNGYKNTEYSILFSKGSYTNNSDTFVLYFADENDNHVFMPIAVTYSDDKWKFSYTTNIGVQDWTYGTWDAVIMTVSVKDGSYSVDVTPVSKFENFQSYTPLDTSYNLTSGGSGLSYLHYVKFTDTGNNTFYHEVVHTMVLLTEGGLYLQDGVFCPAVSFPNDMMIQLKIMAAARDGDSMTLKTSEGSTFTVYSDGLGNWIYGTKKIPYADVSIWYVDADVGSVTIESTTYVGAIYYNGKTYEKGHLYIQFGKNADLLDVGESDNTWTATMNGVWAISTAYYIGENVADSHVEFDKAGKWDWSKEQFLMVFIGIITLGTILCAWKLGMKPLDWIVVAGTGFVIFMMLG